MLIAVYPGTKSKRNPQNKGNPARPAVPNRLTCGRSQVQVLYRPPSRPLGTDVSDGFALYLGADTFWECTKTSKQLSTKENVKELLRVCNYNDKMLINNFLLRVLNFNFTFQINVINI